MKISLLSLIFCLSCGCLCAQQTFQLAPPILKYNSVFFAKNATITAKFAQSQTHIHYTLDGREPSEKDPLYTGPVTIKKNFTTFKTRVFGPPFLPSESAKITFIKTGKKIESVQCTPPDPKYAGSGSATLTDGQGGKTTTDGNTWLGYNKDTVVVTLRLAKKQAIRQVLLNFLQSEGSWIFLPQYIRVSAYNAKTKRYITLGSQEMAVPGAATNAVQCVQKIIQTGPKIKTDQIVITLCPLNKIPDWHAAKGSHAWMFVDEIIVY